MRRFSAMVILFAVLFSLASAHAEKRVALVIGNERYVNLPATQQLQKAGNDARSVGATLKQIRFEIISGENLGRQAIIDKLAEVAKRLSPDDTAFFFFSGHGVTLEGVNYILPSDMPDVGAGEVARLIGAALSEDFIATELKRNGARVTVMVLDACRNNPFARSGTKGVGGEIGLQPREPPSGVFTLYAAGRGEAALDRLSDGDLNSNSVFTRALLPALAKPGLDLTGIAIEVREQVTVLAKSVEHDQTPAYYDGTKGGRIYLAGLPAAPVADPKAAVSVRQPVDGVGPIWAATKDTTSLAVLDDFIRQFGNTPYGSLARVRREELAKSQVAAVPPVVLALPSPDPCSGPVTVSFASQCTSPLTRDQERALQPKATFRECEKCPEMVVVPRGSFTLGAPENEDGRFGDEGPQHVVKFERQFAVGRLHVTRDQFAAFVAATNYDAGSKCHAAEVGGQWVEKEDRSWRNPGFAQQGSHPAVCLNWNDAKAYVDWLAEKTGRSYRLLSEAEFEYAARARTSPGAYPRFWFGNDENDLCSYGNGADQKARDSIEGAKNWTIANCNDGYAYTSPAGYYAANSFGLYDMAGNAWQWTADCSHDSYKGAPADGSAWTNGNCSRRVLRGGSWGNYPRYLRAAIRFGATSDFRVINLGVRVARTLTP
jgi:formylglycine-generating enzyme required for sulfatase activity